MPATNRRIISQRPFNAETAPAALRRPTTPADKLFVRNHGFMPAMHGDWVVDIEGGHGVRQMSLRDLRGRRSKRITMVLECAGNGRSGLDPRPAGVAWGDDAVGCVRFRGVPLRAILAPASLEHGVREIVFRGGDPGRVAFERSLPLSVALHPDTLLAYEMNGRPLDAQHGGPVRLAVPGWFGVASVKWLRGIHAVQEAFQGRYQSREYVYRNRRDGSPAAPVTRLLVKSRFVFPAPGSRVPTGRQARVGGWAWTGHGRVKRVDVSADGGSTWQAANLGPRSGPYAWRRWSLAWKPHQVGDAELLARATDTTGATQPMEPVWNAGGYGNNAAARIRLRVAAR